MSAQDDTEKVLRSLHVMLSKADAVSGNPGKVIIEKDKMIELLTQLNKCVYAIMDEYELTKTSRDKAERQFQKHGDEIIWNANRKAEDIYAASVMYTDEALHRVQDIMKESMASLQALYDGMDKKLKDELRTVCTNQTELKSQLQDLADTDKYLSLIEERNKEIEREKARKEGQYIEKKPSIYANRQTEIKVNTEYFEKMGIPIEDEKKEVEAAEQEKEDSEAKIRVDLDADYFRWKEEEDKRDEQKTKPEEKSTEPEKKEKTRLPEFGLIRRLTSEDSRM